MSLSNSDIERIAHLARINVQQTELSATAQKLTSFFDLVKEMSAVDTKGIEPLSHPFDTHSAVSLRLAEDNAAQKTSREENQKSAPAVEDGLFLVPKVIE